MSAVPLPSTQPDSRLVSASNVTGPRVPTGNSTVMTLRVVAGKLLLLAVIVGGDLERDARAVSGKLVSSSVTNGPADGPQLAKRQHGDERTKADAVTARWGSVFCQRRAVSWRTRCRHVTSR